MKGLTTSTGENVTSLCSYRDDDEGPTFGFEPQVVVQPGIYKLAFVSSRTALLFGNSPKLALRFRIVDHGKFFGEELDRWYNVKHLIGRPGKNGGFKAKPRSDLLREYLTLFPDPVQRLDRMSFRPFHTTLVSGRVETVTENRMQKSLPEPMRYSVVRELLNAGV